MEGPLATDKFMKTAALPFLLLAVLAAAVWIALSWPAGAWAENASGMEPRSIGAPSALCSIVGGMHAKESASRRESRSASSFPELLEDSAPVSTGFGYGIGPGLSFQGVGVFDANQSYASLGPALSVHTGNFGFTAGMQRQVTETGPEDPPDLYYAEFRLLF